MSTATHKRRPKWWQTACLVPLIPLFILLAILVLLWFAVVRVSLLAIIWFWWCRRGHDVLFVYSNSPLWHDYIEQRILPHVVERANVLNWSERKRCSFSLARMAFRHFGGDREFNPLGIVFRPFKRTRTFRFWQPFRDFKHGHPEALQKMEKEFIGLVESQQTIGE